MKKNNKKIDILALLKNADETDKRRILSLAVQHLYNGVGSEDILKKNPDGTIQFEGKTLTSAHLKDLKEQAKILDNLLLWKVLKKDVQYQVNRRMFYDSICDLDMVWGQLLTLLFDIIETRLKKLRE